MDSTTASSSSNANLSSAFLTADATYERLASQVKARVAALAGAPLFTTAANKLWETYLSLFPVEARQHYTCNLCRRFIETYGNLVTLDEKGNARSLLWQEAPFNLLGFAVETAKVTGVFLTSEAQWGTSHAGGWTHLSATPPAASVFKATPLQTAFQAAAEKRTDFEVLSRSVADFSLDDAEKALALLSSEALYRSEKCLGVAQWYRDFLQARQAARSINAKQNVTWRAAAMAPPGFAHVRSTMIGTLLEDIAAGKPMEVVKRSFAAKMNPLQYQRPTAPTKDGQIAQAEKTVEALQSARALDRRFARLEDIEALWRPQPLKPAKGGVFGHLVQPQPSDPPSHVPGAKDITFEKFARTVLDTALSMECLIPSTGSFYALVTAVDPTAPPILQWDRDDRRNPVSWYTYSVASAASTWNLRAGSWAKVTAVTHLPFMWHGGGFDHQGNGAIFVIDGCRDLHIQQGSGFFPEQLRSEYHGVRAVMEAYAKRAVVAGKAEASACGLTMRTNDRTAITVRVTTKAGTQQVYRVDRWD